MGTTLRNIRIDDDLWEEAGKVLKEIGSDRSKAARETYELVTDPLYATSYRLAAERGTTPEQVQRRALEAWVRRIERTSKT